MALAFPWFDVSNPAANYEANTLEERVVRPPGEDHVYADRKLTSRAVEKVDEGTAGQEDSYWTWLRSEDVATPTKVAFALERNAWSDSVDFYTGGLYRFYLSLSQHVKGRDSFARGDIAATTKLIEIRLPGA